MITMNDARVVIRRTGMRCDRWFAAGLCLAVWLLPIGCSKSSEDDVRVARNPKEAASQLEAAFQESQAEIRESALAASEAMRQQRYEQAVVSLQTVKAQENVTFDQGMAIHSSMVTLESELIRAIESGDPNARRAYELLKAMKRN
ncbi:MAG TPA: hypothetical protein PKJ98_14815 [Verrucomicrobiota bacterium]|nr:hypothetical protein [Verrucomicrobiota bacterium]